MKGVDPHERIWEEETAEQAVTDQKPPHKPAASEPQANTETDRILRDSIKEHRGTYLVEYRPADSCLSFACVHLVFLQPDPDVTAVRGFMEDELEHWLKQFAVPVMVSAFDAKEDPIFVPDDLGGSRLMGYIDRVTGNVVRHWGLLKENELPAEQSTPEYLAHVYSGVPYRLQREVREKAERETRLTGRAIRLIVFLMVGVPVVIEIVSLGVSWLAHLLSAVSICLGFHRLAVAMGWLKPSKRNQEEAEKKRKMEHYFYHCELNPKAFEKLKLENFEREAIEQTRKEAEAILKQSQGGKTG